MKTAGIIETPDLSELQSIQERLLNLSSLGVTVSSSKGQEEESEAEDKLVIDEGNAKKSQDSKSKDLKKFTNKLLKGITITPRAPSPKEAATPTTRTEGSAPTTRADGPAPTTRAEASAPTTPGEGEGLPESLAEAVKLVRKIGTIDIKRLSGESSGTAKVSGQYSVDQWSIINNQWSQKLLWSQGTK